MFKKSYLTIALLCASSTSMASSYVGGGIGTVEIYDSDFENATGFELMIGKDISRNMSIEASYIDFGDASDDIAPVWTAEASTIAFGAVAKAPVSNNADLFLKLGIHLWDASIDEEGFGTFYDDTGTDIFFGFGASMKLNRQMSLSARYNSYDFDGDDVNIFSINAQVGF